MLGTTWLVEVGPPERVAAALNLDLRQLEQSLDALKAKGVVEPLPGHPSAYLVVMAPAPPAW
jgi:hypothetical protein